MSIFKNKNKEVNPLADFENAFINKKAKPDPVVKAGSIVLYVILVIAVIACVVMVTLEKKGIAATPVSEPTTVQIDPITDNAAVQNESLSEISQ